jgi:hypothetical protein
MANSQLKLPHESDELAGAPRTVIDQARRGLEAGLVDTAHHTGAGCATPAQARHNATDLTTLGASSC